MKERDDLLWRSRRYQHGLEGVRLLTRKAFFGEGRHVRQHVGPLARRHRERPQLAVLDHRNRRRQRGKDDRRVAADGGLDRRAGAREGNGREVEPEGEPEQLARKMRRGADAGMGEVVVLARLDERGQFLDVLRRHRRVDAQEIGRVARHRHGQEVLVRIVRHFGVEARIDHVARGHEQDRVAVGRRLRRVAHAEIAAGAALVLDDELLLELLRKLLRDQPRRDISGARRGKWHDDLDRMVGIAGCLRVAGDGKKERSAKRKRTGKGLGQFHRRFPATHALPRWVSPAA